MSPKPATTMHCHFCTRPISEFVRLHWRRSPIRRGVRTGAWRHPALIYRLLFKAASQTLLEFGRNPRWLGGDLGITMVLHTWGQNLGSHIHVHCIVTDGALSPDGQRWVTPPRRGFLFPTRALSKVFRGKYLEFLSIAHRSGELRMPGDDGTNETRAFECLKASLQCRDWVVYTKAPFDGAANVVAYLGRYTARSKRAREADMSDDSRAGDFSEPMM